LDIDDIVFCSQADRLLRPLNSTIRGTTGIDEKTRDESA
jgi:hypothetical protein